MNKREFLTKVRGGKMGTIQAIDMAVDFLSSPLIEGFKDHAYPDARKGWDIATIGVGTTIYPSGVKVRRGDICTLDQAKKYLRDYLSKAAIRLQVIKCWDALEDYQKAAIFSFAYNCGTHFYGLNNYRSMTAFLDNYPKLNNYRSMTFFLDNYPEQSLKNVFEVFLLYNSHGLLTHRRAREACLFINVPWDISEEKLDATIKHFLK